MDPESASRRGAATEQRQRSPGRSAREWGRRGIPAAGRAVALAAIEAILADRDGRGRLVPPAADECARVVESFDRAIGATSINLRGGVAALLALVELLPPLVVRRMRRMSKLPLAERIAYLQALEDSPVGVLTVVLVGLKIPMAIYAFEEGEALRMTGFDRSSTASEQPARPATGEAPRARGGASGGGIES